MPAFYFIVPDFCQNQPMLQHLFSPIQKNGWVEDVSALPAHYAGARCVLLLLWDAGQKERLLFWCEQQRKDFQGDLPVLLVNPHDSWPVPSQLRPFQPCEIYSASGSTEELNLRLQLLTENHDHADLVHVFMGLFRKHPAVMFLLDAYSGQIVDANRSAQTFYGYRFDEFLEMTVFDLNEMASAFVAERMDQVRKGTVNRFYFNHRLKNGEIRRVEVNTTYLIIQERELMFTVIQDHTSREQAERALEASESRYRQMVETAAEGIVTLDAHDEVTFVNQKMLGLLEAKYYHDVLGVSFLKFLTPETEQFYEIQKQNLARGVRETQDFQLLTLNNNRLWTSVSMSALLDPEGQIDGVMCFVTNIDVRKQWEKDMERSLRERSLLLQEVNHRVKNNFQLMLSMLRLQQRRLPSDSSEHHMLGAASARLYTMALVHEQIYEKQGLTSLNFQQFVRLLVREVSAYEQGVHPVCQFEIDDVPLSVDEAIVCSLILNEWLRNAYQHAFSGVENPLLSVVLGQALSADGGEEHQAFIRVQDNGVGFDTEAAQAAQTSEGMGLALSRHWARQLSGEISMTSTQAGTTCLFTFPLMH